MVIGGSLAGLKRICRLIDQLPSSFRAPQDAFHPEPVRSRARRTTPAHYCLPLDDIAELLRKLIDGDDAMGQPLS